jgi:bile acid-coenzyme A ligase
LISARAEADPNDTVVIAADGVVTAGELDRCSNRLARAYLDLGVGQDDLVVVCLPNTAEFVVVCAAIWKVGATPMPMSPSLPDDEQSAIEELARPALIVGREPVTGGIPWCAAGYTPNPDLADDELPDAAAASWKAPTTSGSTGVPKVVRASAPATLDPDKPVASFLPRTAVQLISGPLWHSASFTYAFRGLVTGHRLVIMPKFDERRVLDTVGQHRITWMLLSPTMIHRLLRLPPEYRDSADVSSIDSILHMGAPCPPAHKHALINWLGPSRVVEVYAGSESNGLTMIDGDEWLERPGSVGRPIGGTEIQIRGIEGDILPPNTVGEVWMHRAGDATYSYIGRDTRRTSDGWDTLGDAGLLDEDGYLTIVDRVDNRIVTGGIDVYPAAIEAVLVQHPAVRGAVAYGVPDPDLGQVVEVVVDAAERSTDAATADALRAFATDRLDAVCVPRTIHLQDNPVRNDAGKVRRPHLARGRSGTVEKCATVER